MSIFYFTNANLLLRRSHVLTILKTAESIGSVSKKPVTVSSINTGKVEDIVERHSLNREHIEISLRPKSIYHSLMAIKKHSSFKVFYFRDPYLFLYAIFAKTFGMKIFFECHRIPRKIWEKPIWFIAMSLSEGVIFITKILQNSFPRFVNKSIVAHGNTYDPKLFHKYENLSVRNIRESLNLPLDKKILLYAGNTLSYSFHNLFKGIGLIKDNLNLVIVGATNKEKLEKMADQAGIAEKVIIVQRLNNSEVPAYLLSADILVNPYVNIEPGSFPFKLFEYMASGKPIITFINESIEEVLENETNSILIEDLGPEEWVQAITKIMNNQELSRNISTRAKKDSENYTREKRGELIYSFILEKSA